MPLPPSSVAQHNLWLPFPSVVPHFGMVRQTVVILRYNKIIASVSKVRFPVCAGCCHCPRGCAPTARCTFVAKADHEPLKTRWFVKPRSLRCRVAAPPTAIRSPPSSVIDTVAHVAVTAAPCWASSATGATAHCSCLLTNQDRPDMGVHIH